METKEGSGGVTVQRICLAALFGGMLALGGCCTLLLLFAALVAAGWIPEGVMGALGPAACFLSVLVGGCFAVRRGEGAPLILGLATGAVMCLLMLLIGLAAFDALYSPGKGLLGMASALVGGVAAGFCRPQKQARRKARRR